MCEAIKELAISVVGTVIGGLLLAFIFIVFSHFSFFKLPALSGLWRFQSETCETSYNTYKGMKLTFLVLMWQEGNAIHGSGEKVQEDLKGAIKTFTGEDRSRIEIRGYVTKRYFTKSEVVLHFNEQGEKRPSSTMHALRVCDNETMEGTYASTAADSSGKVRWTRGSDGLVFEGFV